MYNNVYEIYTSHLYSLTGGKMKLNEILGKRDFSFKIIVVSNSASMFVKEIYKIYILYIYIYKY